jgi:hypothetical protein
MSLNLAAQHLASKGRHGDDSLVHVSKGELAGLQALAKSHGKSLTVNPQTGLPEAFGLKQLLPMAAGAALVASGVGAPLAAAMVGGGMFAATGSLKQGLMAGLGAYGGAGLMGGITAAGAQEVAGEALAKEAAANQAEQAIAQQTATSATQAANLGAPGVYAPTAPYDAATAADMSYVTPANQLPASSYAATATPEQIAAAKANTGFTELASRGASSLGTEAGRTAAVQGMGGGMQAAQYGLAAASPAIADSLTPKPYEAPEIKGDSDMGQRYIYDSGYDNSIPGRTGQPSYTKVSNEEAKKYYGFADGGEVQYPYGDPVVRMAQGGTAANAVGYGTNYAPGQQFGPGINYSGYDTAPNVGIAAALPKAASGANPNQNIVDLYKEVDAKRAADEAKKAAEEAAAAAQASYDTGGGYAAGGGISTLGGYSDGGRMLKGPGDGMSDSIPAQIGGKQPARLADGEFVVPADVVSHLGNGSTDAGAKQLYKMMDKIRQARTGNKRQGKQINPNKFVPA